MPMDDRRDSLNTRKSEITRELESLQQSAGRSENLALDDLQQALLAELDQVERSLRQIQAYGDAHAPSAAEE